MEADVESHLGLEQTGESDARGVTRLPRNGPQRAC